MTELASGEINSEAAQRWASLIRWGATPQPRVQSPIDVDHDVAWEDQIVDALARLDELGDIVDGTISPAQANELAAALTGIRRQGSDST